MVVVHAGKRQPRVQRAEGLGGRLRSGQPDDGVDDFHVLPPSTRPRCGLPRSCSPGGWPEDVEQVLQPVLLRGPVAKPGARMHVVVHAPTDARLGDVAGGAQVVDDVEHRTFRQVRLLGEVAQPCVRVAVDGEQHDRMVGEERPPFPHGTMLAQTLQKSTAIVRQGWSIGTALRRMV